MKSVSPRRTHAFVPEVVTVRRSASRGIVSPGNPLFLPLFPASICLLILLMAALQVSRAVAEPSPKVLAENGMSPRESVFPPPERVISLAPSLTEIIFDLGAGDMLVGRTARCNEPPEALKVKDVGAYLNPDLERIIALKPDLVLSPEMGMKKEVVERLSDLGIRVFVDNSNTLTGIVHVVRRLGTILGKKGQAEVLINRFTQRREAVAARVARVDKPTILFCVGVDPLVVAGGKSFIGSLIREAGGANVAENAIIPYPRFSMEEVVRGDPDLIVVLNKDCRDQECFSHWHKHHALKAVRKGLVFQLDADLVARPSPKIMEALELLAAILHPQVFGKPLAAGMHRIK